MNRKSIGKTISIIQKKKNIKIKDICNNYFSESTYFRIVNDEIETSIINFDHIIEKLNMTYDEFFFLCNKQCSETYESFMYDIKNAFLAKDILELQRLKRIMKNCNNDSKVIHLEWLSDLLIGRLENKLIPPNENKLAQYLLSIEEWTRYEMVLFNNSIFSFNIDTVNLMIQSFFKKNSFYKDYKKNNTELVQLLINATCCNIQNSDYKKAKQVFSIAKEIFLEEDALYEKNIILFWNGFFELLEGHKNGKKKITSSLNIFSVLGATHLFDMHTDLYKSSFK